MSGKVHPLHGPQREAVNPEETVWLSASAGTGKTQVLSARVLRLLLQPGASPSQILCLTFTKAGAAEMAVRINDVLASWVRMKPAALARDLQAIGADIGPETQARARTLFASVLDCPGGGLRIDTIHAFSQWLLSAFPEEAGLAPGTRAMEDRDRDLLARQVLADMLLDADARGDAETLDALADLSLRKGPDAVETWLMRCASARDMWFGHGAWQPPLRPRVNRLLGLDADADEASVAALCGDDVFDVAALGLCLSAYSQWNVKTGLKGRQVIADWLAAPPGKRLEMAGNLRGILFSQKDTVKDQASLEKFESLFGTAAERVFASLNAVRERKALVMLAGWLTPALTVGRTFALAWEDAKAREGLIDFDDQIRRAADLLGRSDMADWIRYKLDRRFDHILIDEAQDTNAAQWRIIDALIGDFFTGEGQHDGRMRTLFVVGDYKQAIFRFQGTSPENFRLAKDRVRLSMAGALANAREWRGSSTARYLRDLGLGRSFRTARPVLQFVDAAIEAIGVDRFGLDRAPDLHEGEDRPGLVALWPPIGAEPTDPEEEGDEGAEGWLSRPDRQLADRIAAQIAAWMTDGFPLVKGGHRRAGPGDVMVLVRKRKELAGLIVARLHARGVPVAGVDRLRLGAPLAVKDMMAALRFAAQPFDDLNLANLLVSPLVGWSQDDLLAHGWREKRVTLWAHLRASREPLAAATVSQLGDLLALADYEPPQALLHWLLTGPWRGRRRLVERLGHEANDPLDELLNAALAYASAHVPSLAGFIQWFDAGEGELKREQGANEGLVRVMTVHGSKGLQAPIVILADAAGNPDSSPTRGLTLDERDLSGEARAVPLPGLAKDEKVGPIREAEAAAAAAEREEHWRLLYVAMTRAEEALFIAGSLGARETEPAQESWYGQLAPLFDGAPVPDPVWAERREWGGLGAVPEAVSAEASPVSFPVPEWASRPVGEEPRPPRPLAPSAAGEDLSADPPLPPGSRAVAARRGVLVHRLLERLPDIPPDRRGAAARAWLARNAADLEDDMREEIAESALVVLAIPEWEEIFGPDALAEVPLAATVGGQVIAGTADRLLVKAERVLVVDFKTARRPPTDIAAVPAGTIRQMAAYAAALGAIYPGREIAAALLYTHAPRLIPVPDQLLASAKSELNREQQSFPA